MGRHPNEQGCTSGSSRAKGNASRALLIAAIAAASSATFMAGATPVSAALVPDRPAASQGLAPTGAASTSAPDPYRSDVVLVGFRSGRVDR